MKEFKSYHGHVPRDRGSIWYLAPVLEYIVLFLIAAFVLAAIIFG